MYGNPKMPFLRTGWRDGMKIGAVALQPCGMTFEVLYVLGLRAWGWGLGAFNLE